MKVFLTGASSGIGRAIAHELTGHGCEVWGTSRDASRLTEVHPVTMDLLKPNLSLPDEPFDVLINNAGAGVFGPLESLPADAVAAQFRLLLHAPLELIQLVLPGMRQRGRGVIINITSLAALFPVPFMSPYNAAKAALSSATQCLRMELADTPIRVVEIQPGDIATPFHKGTRRFGGPQATWETELHNVRNAPPPETVARAVWRVVNDPNPPPVVRVGSWFQSRLAPLGLRLLPARAIEARLRRQYRV